MADMKSVAAAMSFVLGLVSLGLIVTASATTSWVNSANGNSGLWFNCEDGKAACDNIYIGASMQYSHYEMVRGFAVLSCCMGLLGVMLGLLSFFKKLKLNPAVVGTSYIVQAFFVVVAVSLFTNIQSSYGAAQKEEFSWGYSFGLGWGAFPCSLIAGGIMIALDSSKNAA